MASQQTHIPSEPAVLDVISLRNIQLPLPEAPDSWHRPGKPQPCTVSLRLSYSSAIASAAADDVSLSIDYGKLYRRLEEDIKQVGNANGNGQDFRVTAGIVANCALGLLDDTAASVNSTAMDREYGKCEVWLHLPKALLRAEGGLTHRSVTAKAYNREVKPSYFPVIVEEEFRIEGIRSHCILGVNPHERVEKQAVITSLEFKGSGEWAWGSKVVDTYQALTRAVAERVEETSFQSVEALATFVARIATVDFDNEQVKVLVEKPSALAFVERSGVEVIRSKAFFK
ncbi:hypothetical protein ASPWEDRAFT_105411 [Aspergillus wentii DTO 134E9]|uniref:dihydroneopterin aldolase n=1 Tax=Aspergillus wentii DTO 134E9 TaxID=1073089 RepID=A0A1L9RWA3_ASPWE|nr:uncharacterized protein ASPWEDRAFT_105411 [Aspergillus wentii DTO 134E9]KAI9929165.1 hypothetical protein MW887_001569 [Aspergillus wentii]OJJ39137.1 hypothetical protein ASPWEDRAFT_105411 [Aspergillus wentii DTO 134E9]